VPTPNVSVLIRTTEIGMTAPRLKIMLHLFVCNHSFAYSTCTTWNNSQKIRFAMSLHIGQERNNIFKKLGCSSGRFIGLI